MAPPFPKVAPTLARIETQAKAVLPVRDRHEKQAIYLGAAAVLCSAMGTPFFFTLASALGAACVWHGYQRWVRLGGTSLIAHIRLPEEPVVDALDFQWLNWAQWKEPRTRAYLQAKRPAGDYRISDIHDLMLRMSIETTQFNKHFRDPDEAWEALEARRRQERCTSAESL